MRQQERWARWEAAVAAAIASRPSEATRRSYARAWRGWIDHLDGRGPWEATRRDVLAWIKRLRARGLQRNSVALRLMQCHAVWESLRAAGLVDGPANSGLGGADLFTLAGTELGVDQTLRRTPALTSEQAERLLTSIGTHCMTGARDYALLGTLLATGGRPAEVLRMRVGDLGPHPGPDANGLVRLDGREIPVPQQLVDVATDYLDLAGRWYAKPEHFLWRPLRDDAAARFWHELPHDRPITGTQLNCILRKRLRMAGVPESEQYSATSLRMTFAREWQVRQPGDAVGLQRRLGHRRPATTAQWMVA
jgi:integrase